MPCISSTCSLRPLVFAFSSRTACSAKRSLEPLVFASSAQETAFTPLVTPLAATQMRHQDL
eukprot:5231092-Amphidinium_carterae.1